MLFCTGFISLPIFGAIFDSMEIEFGYLIGFTVGILVSLTFACIYLGFRTDKILMWGFITFVLYNVIVGTFIICIFAAIGHPLNIFGGIDYFFGFIGMTIGISIGIIFLFFILIAFASSYY